ncbi:MAG: alpha/beta hydrolase [Rhodobacter sp.]|uniref:alpha/beta hydrolase n=1 Tax=Pararhodobacter sp. TaxID=2127056 RepID=UPI001DBB0CEB|nr:alpha/beta hydrolase [Pararhodobacter sp.]MCB1345488.1 alpha/beta hydrolase [Paracoccaceae bacterium]MCC0073404.1 alpha/beta hydrolase [Rhodobacter sp.]HPD92865.1 alpha/beta hydrolase [Pararhodobacter sp.]
MTQVLTTPQGRRIAYVRTPGTGPGVVFLGGFKSDMTGTKAQFLEHWARDRGRAFLRFDYSGHGQSSGDFLDGCIGDWSQDAMEAIRALTDGPQVLVGSSMGGWIALLVARAMPDRVAALVGIAAAPDFTEDGLWSDFSDDQRARLDADGVVDLPSEYDDAPYRITRRLIEDGRTRLVLRSPLPLPFPVRLLQGSNDTDVPVSVALRLFEHADSPDLTLSLVKGADHRFSEPDNLALLARTLADLPLTP